MSQHDDTPYMVLDHEFFTSFDRWVPAPEYRDVAWEILARDEWSAKVGGVWTFLRPGGWQGPAQGWKLHVSAMPRNAETVLRRVVEVIERDRAAFKFASDRRILNLLLAKNWPREGGGKFITIYPADEAQFRRLGQALAEATRDLDGPYVLSDRRVPGSRIVFYRYGEHVANLAVDVHGSRHSTLVVPGGQAVPEVRKGYYQIPDGVDDPYGARGVRVVADDDGEAAEKKAEKKKVTLRERYRVDDAIKYSNVGGVYRGTDLETGRAVVIRERRPYTGWISPNTDAVGLLRNEAAILRRMDGTGWTAGYVDAFQVWEHHFLVMEEVPGVSLRDFASSQYRRRGKVASPRRLFSTFRKVLLELVRGIEAFHHAGVVLRDLSVSNVLVRPDLSPCFIDLEYAWERDPARAYAPRIATPGFASPSQVAGAEPRESDDWYALGAVLVEMCSFSAAGLALAPAGALANAAAMMDEVGLPGELLEVARGLLHPDPEQRWDGAAVHRALRSVRAGTIGWDPRLPGRAVTAGAPRVSTGELAEVVEGVCRFMEAAADPAASDCLWPSAPAVYRTNPVSVQLGACGPLEYVRRVRGACPPAWLDWVERHTTASLCPPGLYAGTAGVATTLYACGRRETALRLLREAAESPLLADTAGLYYGMAGVGVALLEVGTAAGDPGLLEAAVRIGAELEARAEERGEGVAWRSAEGTLPCGLATGGSGVALFCTYLGACTGEPRWWSLARRALAFEVSLGRSRSGYWFWPDAAGKDKRFWSPHVSFGSAGIAAALARLHACTGDAGLLPWMERCGETLTYRWTNKLWQEMGYAGWGDTLLDLHAATGDDAYRAHAERMAEVLLPTRVATRLGVAFPGSGWARVTADYGMGTAGIATFLHRLATPGTPRAFFPDHLLAGWAEGAVSVPGEPGTSGAAAAPPPPARAPRRARARTHA